MRESLAEAQIAAGSIAHDVSVPVSRIPEFIQRTDAALTAAYPGIRHCAFGHVGDGNMHYNPVRPVAIDWPTFKQERPHISRIVHDIVMELGGSISAERHRPLAAGGARALQVAGGTRPAAHDETRAGSTNIMNPGKVVPV